MNKPEENKGLIKVCGNSTCDAVWHNVPFEVKKCKDCGGSIKMIDEETFWKKFSDWYFQYDYATGEYYRPEKKQN